MEDVDIWATAYKHGFTEGDDEDAIRFETAYNGEGPDVVAVINGDAFGAILAARRAKAQADEALEAAVVSARTQGETWEAIGAALGISRQAAHAKYAQAVR